MSRIAKLVPPHMDKHWSFQVMHRLEEDEHVVKSTIHRHEVKNAEPFIQGLDRNWIMVEFWTNDKEAVTAAANALAEALGLSYTEGEFTREEIFPS